MIERVYNFKGIYTNIQETSLPFEYCKSTNAKITHNGLETEQYSLSEIKDLKELNHPNMLHFSLVSIDNDNNGISYINGEFVSNYIKNVVDYYLIVVPSFVYLYDKKWNKVKEFSYSGEFVKVLSDRGYTYLLTSSNIYKLCRLKRTTNRLYNTGITFTSLFSFQINTSLYEVDDIHLVPSIYPYTNSEIINDNFGNPTSESLAATVELERIGSGTISKSIEYVVYREVIVPINFLDKNPVPGKCLIIAIKDADSKEILDYMYFSNYVNSARRVDENSYMLLPTTTSSSNLIRILSYSFSTLLVKCGENGWDKYGLESITKLIYTKTEIDSILKSTKDKYESQLSLNEYNGFISELSETHYLVSYLFDDGMEVPIEETKLPKYLSGGYSAFSLKVTFPYNLDVRVTAFRIYIKHSKDDTYELIYEHSFYKNRSLATVLTRLDLTGIYSTQTFQFNDPFKAKVVNTFDDGEFINGVLYILKNRNVYYPVVGNGNIVKVYYEENVLPKVSGDKIIPFSNAIGIVDKYKTSVVSAYSKDGAFLFKEETEMGIAVENEKSVISTPDGNIYNSSYGIILTDGGSMKILSEAINNIVKENYKLSSLFYNPISRELYYLIPSKQKFYAYDFERQVWTEKEYINISNLFVSKNSDVYVSSDSTYLLTKKNVDCIYRGNLASFNYIDFYKIITHITFDFVGEIVYNGVTITRENRGVSTIFKTLDQRIPKDYEEYEFKIKAGTILCGFLINFDLIKKINEYSE